MISDIHMFLLHGKCDHVTLLFFVNPLSLRLYSELNILCIGMIGVWQGVRVASGCKVLKCIKVNDSYEYG
jgi:hypothetical protein